jgi:hypothetical protein
MVGWSGEGVETPLVGVVVVGAGVVDDDILRVEEGLVTTALELDDAVVSAGGELNVVGLDVEGVANVEDAGGVNEGCGVEEGEGSLIASTQYEFPTTRPPQSAVMDGF